MYKKLQSLLPRDLKYTFSGIRGYAEGALDFHKERSRILMRRKGTTLKARRHEIRALTLRVEELTIVLFTYAMYLKFASGDKAIKEAVSTFEELGIKHIQIGSMELSRRSRYFNLGAHLARDLVGCIEDQILKDMISRRAHFYEIATWYGGKHDSVV